MTQCSQYSRLSLISGILDSFNAHAAGHMEAVMKKNRRGHLAKLNSRITYPQEPRHISGYSYTSYYE